MDAAYFVTQSKAEEGRARERVSGTPDGPVAIFQAGLDRAFWWCPRLQCTPGESLSQGRAELIIELDIDQLYDGKLVRPVSGEEKLPVMVVVRVGHMTDGARRRIKQFTAHQNLTGAIMARRRSTQSNERMRYFEAQADRTNGCPFGSIWGCGCRGQCLPLC